MKASHLLSIRFSSKCSSLDILKCFKVWSTKPLNVELTLCLLSVIPTIHEPVLLVYPNGPVSKLFLKKHSSVNKLQNRNTNKVVPLNFIFHLLNISKLHYINVVVTREKPKQHSLILKRNRLMQLWPDMMTWYSALVDG